MDSTSSRCDSTPRNSAVRLRTLLDVASTRVAEMRDKVGTDYRDRTLPFGTCIASGAGALAGPALTAKVNFSTKGCDYIGNKRSPESQVS